MSKLEESLARQKPQEATLFRQSLSTAGTYNVLDSSQKICTLFITQDSHLTFSLDFFIIVSLSIISCFDFSWFHFPCPQPGTKKTPQNPTKNQNKQNCQHSLPLCISCGFPPPPSIRNIICFPPSDSSYLVDHSLFNLSHVKLVALFF